MTDKRGGKDGVKMSQATAPHLLVAMVAGHAGLPSGQANAQVVVRKSLSLSLLSPITTSSTNILAFLVEFIFIFISLS